MELKLQRIFACFDDLSSDVKYQRNRYKDLTVYKHCNCTIFISPQMVLQPKYRLLKNYIFHISNPGLENMNIFGLAFVLYFINWSDGTGFNKLFLKLNIMRIPKNTNFNASMQKKQVIFSILAHIGANIGKSSFFLRKSDVKEIHLKFGNR